MFGPSSCPSGEGCNSIKFSCFGEKEADSSNLKDYQEIRIQEQAQKLSVGTIPRTISAVLEDDLVDLCKPGDDITVYGVVLRRWKPTFNDVSINFYLVEVNLMENLSIDDLLSMLMVLLNLFTNKNSVSSKNSILLISSVNRIQVYCLHISHC